MAGIKQHLNIGDRITVLYHGRSYSSVVQDMPESDALVIAQPTNMGIYLNLMDDEGEVLFSKENGILTFQAVQEDRFYSNAVPMLRLRAVTDVLRSQRRSYFRLEKSLPVQLTVKQSQGARIPSPAIRARTVNLSGGGCRIAMRQPLEEGMMVECRIALGQGPEVTLEGQVVWVEKNTGLGKTNYIGVQFLEESAAAQKLLVSYVTNEQRRQLKENR